MLLSTLFYQYKYCGCNATYYGNTKRHFKVPICERLINGHTTSNPRRFGVDIALIRRRPNFNEFPRHFRVLFDVISIVKESTSFPRTFFNEISLVEKFTLFPPTFFDIISMGEKSTLFPGTFIGVISLVEKSTLFPRTFFDVISMVEKSTLFHVLLSV